MKLAIEFPSVAYREGADGVVRLARGCEAGRAGHPSGGERDMATAGLLVIRMRESNDVPRIIDLRTGDR